MSPTLLARVWKLEMLRHVYVQIAVSFDVILFYQPAWFVSGPRERNKVGMALTSRCSA